MYWKAILLIGDYFIFHRDYAINYFPNAICLECFLRFYLGPKRQISC